MYFVEQIREDRKVYYFIRCGEDMSIVPGPTKYLVHKLREHCSPNTIKRIAYSISYYLTFLDTLKMNLDMVLNLPYDKQTEHFIDFLWWLKYGKHTMKLRAKLPNNYTCNTYLRDVFGWFQFMELLEREFGSLKVLFSHKVTFINSVGVKMSRFCKTFKGYLPETGEHKGRTIEEDKLIVLFENCTNTRDQLLIMLLAETGFRIGEVLGIRYTKDINYEKRYIYVRYREGSENNSRAKYAEDRHVLLSEETFDLLIDYLVEYKELLKNEEYLFINIMGETKGKALKVHSVYAMFERLEKKTDIKATPHMIRHYYANSRYRSGWDLLLISRALGHRHISTTEAYLNIKDEELIQVTIEYMEQNKNLFPVDKLL